MRYVLDNDTSPLCSPPPSAGISVLCPAFTSGPRKITLFTMETFVVLNCLLLLACELIFFLGVLATPLGNACGKRPDPCFPISMNSVSRGTWALGWEPQASENISPRQCSGQVLTLCWLGGTAFGGHTPYTVKPWRLRQGRRGGDSTISDSICLPQPPLSTGLLHAVILLLRIPRPEGWVSIGFSRSYDWEKVKPAFLIFPFFFYIFRYCAGLPPVQTKVALTFHPPLQFKTAPHLQKFLLAF